MAKEADIHHLIRNGALVYTWLDLETTDKEWQSAEITVASLTTTDIAYNMLADELYEVCVPDRVVLSPEAMAITRYTARQVRNHKRLSPQIAAAKIFEDVQAAPFRLWDRAGKEWRDALGDALWQHYIDEKIISIPKKTIGLSKEQQRTKEILVRHYPVLDDEGRVQKSIRMHAPSPTRKMMEMSYLVGDHEAYDYTDENGHWKIRQMDKFNLGFRNTYFDNRAMAARLFSAMFPHSEIYAMNKKGLGNHSVDVFTLALGNHFFSTKGAQNIRLGKVIDPETNREKLSAKLDLIMENSTWFSDLDIQRPPGVRVWDGTLHNLKKGHNQPDYDNAKSIGVHRFMRQADPDLQTHIEKLGNIDYFRQFMNSELEDGADFPTSHPIRFIIATGNDDTIYRAVPVMVLGGDDQKGKFNRVWAIRLDQDYTSYRYEGKLLTELSKAELAHVIRTQRGQPNAVFHEIHLKRHRGAYTLQAGLAAGHCPDISVDTFRKRRDDIAAYIDENNESFIEKAMDAWEMQYPFKPPADEYLPYVEEELWTAMGDVKYPYIINEDGEKTFIPRLIRDMAQDTFKRNNARIGDNIRALIRPQPIEWQLTLDNALAYARLRANIAEKLDNYLRGSDDRISLPDPYYDPAIISKSYEGDIEPEDILATVRLDRLSLIGQVYDTTRQYDVQILRTTLQENIASRWQTIPFDELAKIDDKTLLSLKEQDRLRIKFEENPSLPTLRFGIRYAMENNIGPLLSEEYQKLYQAEEALYIHGPPQIADPDKHRVMSVAKSRLGVQRMQHNLIPQRERSGEQISALRDGETGARDIFLNEDLANAILGSVEDDNKRLNKAHPFTDKHKRIMGIDPKTNHPYINVEHIIPEKHLIVKIPEGLPEKPISDRMMGHCCFVIPDQKKLLKAKHIILEEEKTGRRFYAADHVLYEAPPPSHGSTQIFYEQADNIYSAADASLPKQIKILSCQALYPITKMQDHPYPIVHIDNHQLLATRAPRYAGFQRNEPVSGFIVRQYDYKFRKGQKIRLRGINPEGTDTGWETRARIAEKPQEFSLSELLSLDKNPDTYDQYAQIAFACGFANGDDMKAHLLDAFTRFDENITAGDNKLYFFKIKEVKKIYYWTTKQPKACFKKRVNKQPKKYSALKPKPAFPPKITPG